jgi:hypothetical protein
LRPTQGAPTTDITIQEGYSDVTIELAICIAVVIVIPLAANIGCRNRLVAVILSIAVGVPLLGGLEIHLQQVEPRGDFDIVFLLSLQALLMALAFYYVLFAVVAAGVVRLARWLWIAALTDNRAVDSKAPTAIQTAQSTADSRSQRCSQNPAGEEVGGDV